MELKAGEIMLTLNYRGQLIPLDGESAERYTKLKHGEAYKFCFKRMRNYKFHKKYFALLNVVFKNQDVFDNMDWFRKHALIAVGWCDTFVHPSGQVLNEVKSISFDKCSESDFRELYEKTVTFFVAEYGMEEDLLMKIVSF